MNSQKQTKDLPSSQFFSLAVNGYELDVLHTGVADFAVCELDASDWPVEFEVGCPGPLEVATVHPISRGVKERVRNDRIVLVLEGLQKLSVVVPGQNRFFAHEEDSLAGIRHGLQSRSGPLSCFLSTP